MSVLDNLTDDDWYKLQLRVIKLEEQQLQFADFAQYAAHSLRVIAGWIAKRG